jgi:hypothetical protein
LEGFGIRAELLRSRLQPIATNSFQKPFASADRSELFETNVLRSYLRVANGISAEVKARIAEEFVAG